VKIVSAAAGGAWLHVADFGLLCRGGAAMRSHSSTGPPADRGRRRGGPSPSHRQGHWRRAAVDRAIDHLLTIAGATAGGG